MFEQQYVASHHSTAATDFPAGKLWSARAGGVLWQGDKVTNERDLSRGGSPTLLVALLLLAGAFAMAQIGF